jgi:hypothetical protein
VDDRSKRSQIWIVLNQHDPSHFRDLNLTDLLFKYGVRLNNELLLDLYCNPIPLVQEFNGQPQTKFFRGF